MELCQFRAKEDLKYQAGTIPKVFPLSKKKKKFQLKKKFAV